MQMYNETRRKTSSVRLFLQRKRLMRDGFWEGMYYKKRRVSIPDTQSLLTLNLIPWKTQCKYTRFMLYNMLFWRISAFY